MDKFKTGKQKMVVGGGDSFVFVVNRVMFPAS